MLFHFYDTLEKAKGEQARGGQGLGKGPATKGRRRELGGRGVLFILTEVVVTRLWAFVKPQGTV